MQMFLDCNVNNTHIQSGGINHDLGIYDSPDELLEEHDQEMPAFQNFLFILTQ
mgnify:CR=1 FL=1